MEVWNEEPEQASKYLDRTFTHSRIFNSQDGTRIKTQGSFTLISQLLDQGLYSYYTDKKELEYTIEEGPLFTELTQFFCKDIAMKTRIFNPRNKKSPYKYTLQQQILIDSINVTQEIIYLINSPIQNNKTLYLDDADFSTRKVSTENRATLGCMSFILSTHS